MTQIKQISKALDDSLKSDSLETVTVELVESLSESMLNDGLLKDIPIIGTLVGLTKTGINIKDRLFVKKILTFLFNINNVSAEKRTEMIEKIDANSKYKIKVGEKLLYIIDKCEDHEKAKLIGILFSAFLNKFIDYSEFLKASKVIENSLLEDIEWFVMHDFESLYIEEAADYVNCGLFEITPISLSIEEVRALTFDKGAEYTIKGGKIETKITSIGKLIRKILRES